jgi:LacI family kdg operon repressor
MPHLKPPKAVARAPEGSPQALNGKHTIDDVARSAGVSKATVSRYLNPGAKQLSPEIAARVEGAIRDLGYRPSPMAQALKRGRSRLIGLVVADVTNPYSVAVLQGAEKTCREAGYIVMLFNIGNEEGRERQAIQALSSYQVEGFLLHTLGRDSGALADAAQHGKPVVLIDRRLGDNQVDLVGLDNGAAVRLCVEHLTGQGYRHLLFVTEPMPGVSSRLEREAAFRASMPELGQTFECDADDAPALDKALQSLRRRARGDACAVISANAVITLRVAAAAARLGLSLGQDIGLVGFDDTDWAPLVGPGLSTISQPTDDIGRCAARCLIERVQGLQMPARQILLPGALVERGSSRRDG